MKELAQRYPNVTLVLNKRNEGHGPALDYAARLARTRFLFTLDSDTRTIKCGFLGAMMKHFERNDKLLAVGWRRWVNRNGVAQPVRTETHHYNYIHPYAALYDLDKYFLCEPFKHGGAPGINLMLSGKQQGYKVKDFPIKKYVWHQESGTRGWFNGRWNPKTDAEKNQKWEQKPI